MSLSTKGLKEQRADVVRSLNSLSDTVSHRTENPVFSDEEKNQFDALDKQQAELSTQIETAERIERSKQLAAPAEHKEIVAYRPAAPSDEDKNLVFRAWALRQSGKSDLINRNMRQAVERLGYDLDNREMIFRSTDGQSIGDGNNSSYLINGEIVQTVVEAQKAYGGLQSVCSTITTPDGTPLRFPTVNDTSATGQWLDELDAVDDLDATFGKVVLNAYLMGTGCFPISFSLLSDSRISLSQWVFKAMGTRIGRTLAAALVNGDGSAKPTGITNATYGATAGVTTADEHVILPDEIIELEHSVDPAYRNDPSCCFLMNDATWQYLKTLKDEDNRPLYLPFAGYAGAAPKTLLGYPVVIDQAMPKIEVGPSDGPKVILFGKMSEYLLRQVGQVDLRVSNELYVTQYATAFLGFARFDGTLLNRDAVKVLKMKSH